MKYYNVRQHSQEDCGAACLASIAKVYGKTFTLAHVREAVGTGQLGTTLLGLKRGAETLGFKARAVQVQPESLRSIGTFPLPAIVHWKGYHWVVLYQQRGKRFVIADPAVGIRYLSQSELRSGWTDGVMLLLEPDLEHFLAQSDDATGSWNRFLKNTWEHRQLIATVLVMNLFLGILSLSAPFLMQILTDDVLMRGDLKLLAIVAIAVIVLNCISSSLGYIQSLLIAHFTQRLELGLVLDFSRQLLRLPLQYFETRRSGEIVSRLRDIQEINQLVGQIVVGLPSQLFIAIVSLGLMLLYSAKLTAVALGLAVVMILSTVMLVPLLQEKTRSLLVLEAENQGILVETFKGALTLRTLNAAPQFWDELQSRFGRLANLTFRTLQIGIINRALSGFVSAVSSIILLWFGSSFVIANELTIGQLIAFNSMNTNFLAFIAALLGVIHALVQAQTGVQRLTEVIAATPEDFDASKKPAATLSSTADIVCSHLTFNYPGRLELLEDFSLTIPGGQTIALIGKSGCGKSTLAKLIAGLYPVQSGNLRIGLYNLQDLSLACVRQQVVLVPQDAHFWSRSILENFRLAAPQATFEQIVQACRITEADQFISQLPDKYQTVLGEFGANLSGGQRQRLAIARALLSDPPILILDESTSGLDPVSESQVLDRLLLHRTGKTTILISHRSKVIDRSAWIVFLEQGKLKLQGSLNRLRSTPGSHLEFLSSAEKSIELMNGVLR
ncbi:peptidase domain-containing ABC transporter [Cyanobacteria bacterium FACHB-DQ100]|nr:peptidase domain-containing ABC transporter [Cyanobacteria bacterium FACHB-DQ100]